MMMMMMMRIVMIIIIIIIIIIAIIATIIIMIMIKVSFKGAVLDFFFNNLLFVPRTVSNTHTCVATPATHE